MAEYTMPSETELIAAAPAMYRKLEKIVAWLERLASQSEERAKDTRFITLSEANAADAKNYRATADDIRSVMPTAEVRG